jgi:O-antigen biosynthesis protein
VADELDYDARPDTANADAAERPSIGKGTSARHLLRPRGRTGPLWAVFYPDWYLATYAEARAAVADASFGSVLNHYLDVGQAVGHSPNPFFDEAWYRATYPDVVAAIAEGHVGSGFDQYCHSGFSRRSPHWLFDEAGYRARYPDLSEEVLAAQGFANGYDHYLRAGDREGRTGGPFFDPALYRAQLPDGAAASSSKEGPFVTYLRLQEASPERRTTLYFDPDWYRTTYPAVAAAIAAGEYRSTLHHYLTNPTPAVFDPLPVFSEFTYRDAYLDIAEAVAAGHFRCGYQHFLKNGISELRAAGPLLDLQWYVTNNATVGADLAAGRARDALTHYLTIGLPAGLNGVPTQEPAALPNTTAQQDPAAALHQAAMLYRSRGSAALPVMARRGLDFSCAGPPTLSVIMLLHDELALALTALAALRDRTPGDLELILIDCGSHDETRHIHRYVRGARLVRFDLPIDPAAARNAALGVVTAATVLLLGNDTEPAHGAVAAALERLNGDGRIGAVSGRLVGADGRLRTAGGIIWREGGLLDYMSGLSALAPEANFVRVVDFCSSAFLLVRTAVLQQLDGFDARFTDADYADADLCVRIAAAGHRVVYDPDVLIHQLGAPGPAVRGEDAKEMFFRKHINQLRFRYPSDPKVEIFARALDAEQQRVLFIEDLLPLRRIGSGFVRSNDLIRVLASMDVFVTVFAINPGSFDLAAIYADMPDSVEVMHDRSLIDLDALFEERQGYYDLIWVARTHNLDRILTRLEHMTTGTGRPPRVVLDTEAIVALRQAARHRLPGQELEFDLEAAILKEFANAHHCQNITVVTEQEATTLRGLGFSDVKVVGHIRDLMPTPRAFAERSGLLFIGAIHETDSPNFDGLVWFVDEVLPLIEEQLGWETRLSVVGYTGVGVSLERFRAHPRITLRGTVPETESLYNSHRVFIAPTRYAAGTPYKVYEAASFGLPVVATDLLRQQIGWEDGKELLAADHADPALFARHVVTLYRDAAVWQTVRDQALARLAAENGREHYVQALTEILEG